MDRRFVAKYHGHLRLHNKKRDTWKFLPDIYEVPCTSMAYIIKQTNIDHISALILDVDGAELEILETVAYDEVRFDVMVIETEEKYRPKGFKRQVNELLRKFDYKFIADKGKNSWYRHDSFSPKARPFDTFPFNVDNYQRNDSWARNFESKSDNRMIQYKLFRFPVYPNRANPTEAFDTFKNILNVTIYGHAVNQRKESSDDRNIPRLVWISTASTPSVLPDTLLYMVAKNPLWTFLVFNSSQQTSFIGVQK